MEGVAATALMTAAARARESGRPDRLIDDPWAAALAGQEGRDFLARQDRIHLAPDAFVVRHRFFDDFAMSAVRSRVRQVVLVAAGLDTRAYRLTWPDGTRLYEIDQPDVLDYKQSVLDAAGAVAGCERVVVPIDLRDRWTDALIGAGFDPTQPVAWVAEGLLVYLPESAVRDLLKAMASLSTTASFLASDTFSAAMLAAEDRQAWVKLYADFGAPFVFGTDDPLSLLSDCGWAATIHPFGEIAENLGRAWPIPGTPGYPPAAILTAVRI